MKKLAGFVLVFMFLTSFYSMAYAAIPDVKDVKLNPSNSTFVDQLAAPSRGETIAVVKTSMGNIKLRFFPQFAPKAVENFLMHAQNGYYNGVSFHRVIDGFMIQSGDPRGNGSGGESIWNKPFEDEFAKYLNNIRGALSMANAGPATNGSQFFINQSHPIPGIWDDFDKNAEVYLSQMQYDPRQVPADIRAKYEINGGNMWLDGAFRTSGGHTVFGQVFEGMDIVDKIAQVETDPTNEKPLNDVIIKEIYLTTFQPDTIVMRLNTVKALLGGASVSVDPSNKDVAPFTLFGKTMVPVRFVQQLGANVKYDSNDKSVVVSYGNIKLELEFDNPVMKKTVGNAAPVDVKLPTAPTMVEGKTCVPIREVAEGLGFSVKYDSASFVIVASTKELAPADLAAKIREGDGLKTVIEAVKGIDATTKSYSIAVGERVQILRADIILSPASVGCNKLVYSSSDTNVATVTSNGLIISQGKGTATVTISSHNGKTVKVTVTVI